LKDVPLTISMLCLHFEHFTGATFKLQTQFKDNKMQFDERYTFNIL